MKCHYCKDPETGDKVLIPYCMQVVMSNDIKDCTCYSFRMPTTKKLLEERIKELYIENENLKSIIKNKSK